MENMNKRQQRVFLASGIPGSGKTTTMQKLWQKFGGNYISRDEVRFAKLNDNDAYFGKEDEVFNDFIKLITASMSTGEDVFIDATHLTPKARHKTLVRLPSGDYKTIAVCVEVPLPVALIRNDQRTGRACVPADVISNMFKSYRRASLEEPWFDEIWVVDEFGHINVVEKRVTNEENIDNV